MSEPLSIIYHRGYHDEIMMSLNLAAAAAVGNRPVRMLFSGWALERLGQQKLGEVVLSPQAESRIEWYRESLGVGETDQEMLDTFKSIKSLGDVKIFACSRACDLFEISLERISPLVDQIIGTTHFILEEARSGPILFL